MAFSRSTQRAAWTCDCAQRGHAQWPCSARKCIGKATLAGLEFASERESSLLLLGLARSPVVASRAGVFNFCAFTLVGGCTHGSRSASVCYCTVPGEQHTRTSSLFCAFSKATVVGHPSELALILSSILLSNIIIIIIMNLLVFKNIQYQYQ